MKIQEMIFKEPRNFSDEVLEKQRSRRERLFFEVSGFNDLQRSQLIHLIGQFDDEFKLVEAVIQFTIPFAALSTFILRARQVFDDSALSNDLQAISDHYEVHWRAGKFDFNVSKEPVIYGILNITPDSFYDGGRFQDPVAIQNQIDKMVTAGTDVIEINGQTTRPGFTEVTPTEELRRISSTADLIKEKYPQIALAVDTYKLPVMREMVGMDVDIINDVNAFVDDRAKLELLKDQQTGLLTMHSSRETEYDNLTVEMKRFFEHNLAELSDAGINRERIAIDQGIGYSKVADGYQDYAMMRNIDQFNYLSRPIMVAISRKGFGAKLFGLDKDDRLPVTLIAEAYMYLHGGRILRVHDVEETMQLVKMLDTITAGYWHRQA